MRQALASAMQTRAVEPRHEMLVLIGDGWEPGKAMIDAMLSVDVRVTRWPKSIPRNPAMFDCPRIEAAAHLGGHVLYLDADAFAVRPVNLEPPAPGSMRVACFSPTNYSHLHSMHLALYDSGIEPSWIIADHSEYFMNPIGKCCLRYNLGVFDALDLNPVIAIDHKTMCTAATRLTDVFGVGEAVYTAMVLNEQIPSCMHAPGFCRLPNDQKIVLYMNHNAVAFDGQDIILHPPDEWKPRMDDQGRALFNVDGRIQVVTGSRCSSISSLPRLYSESP